jgi:hypothetical protein
MASRRWRGRHLEGGVPHGPAQAMRLALGLTEGLLGCVEWYHPLLVALAVDAQQPVTVDGLDDAVGGQQADLKGSHAAAQAELHDDAVAPAIAPVGLAGDGEQPALLLPVRAGEAGARPPSCAARGARWVASPALRGPGVYDHDWVPSWSWDFMRFYLPSLAHDRRRNRRWSQNRGMAGVEPEFRRWRPLQDSNLRPAA